MNQNQNRNQDQSKNQKEKKRSLTLEEIQKIKDEIVFIPLGGSSEIGMNLNLYYLNGTWLMIDCGIGFADQSIAGVDIITPNVSFLIRNQIKLTAAIITHIHEDHIGGLPYLWKYLECPLHLTPLARELLIFKMKNLNLRTDKLDITELNEENKNFSIGNFDLEIVGITHSVPEMKMVNIKTPFGNIVHTGDWKLDDTPVVGDKTDLKRIKEIGKEGVHTIVCDSTNVFSSGWSGSEGTLEKSLIGICKGKTGKIVITTFASNIARIKTITEVAKRLNRKIVLCGFALVRITKIAKSTGYLLEDSCTFVDARESRSIPDSELLVLATGCQGEPLASVNKITQDTHPYISINENDTIIFSSKIIPGNEKKIFAIFNKLAMRDIEIITERDHHVHVSGHPNRDELKKMYSILKPRFAIPVHGEPYHITEHVEFAKTLGVEHAQRVKNGDAVLISKDKVERLGFVTSGHLCIDGNTLRDVRSTVLSDRLKLSFSGVIYCIIIYNSTTSEMITEPTISAPGLLDDMEDKTMFQNISSDITKYIQDNIHDGASHGQEREFISKLEKFITKLITRELNKSPLVEINLKVIK